MASLSSPQTGNSLPIAFALVVFLILCIIMMKNTLQHNKRDTVLCAAESSKTSFQTVQKNRNTETFSCYR